MTVQADRELCVGGGQCVLAAPHIFDQDEDGLVIVLRDPDPAEMTDAETAAQLCPARAIDVDGG